MFVASEYRGAQHGVAQELLNTLLRCCAACNVAEAYLGTVEKLEAARRFYQKNRFEQIPRTLLPTLYPVTAVDTMFYYRRVGQSVQ